MNTFSNYIKAIVLGSLGIKDIHFKPRHRLKPNDIAISPTEISSNGEEMIVGRISSQVSSKCH